MLSQLNLLTLKQLVCSFSIINGREAIAFIIGDIVVFYNSKKLNFIGALFSFFKICSHIFMIFEVKLE